MRITSSEAEMLRRRAAKPPSPKGRLLPGGVVIYVPGKLVNPLNLRKGRSGWAFTRWTKRWKEAVADALLEVGYRRGMIGPAIPKRVRFSCFVFNRLDRDGCLAALKPALDGLVTCGVISSDSPTSGHEFPDPEQAIDRKGWRGVEITVGPR